MAYGRGYFCNMRRVRITLFCLLAGALSLEAQQTTIINHYQGETPEDGQMMQYVLRSSEQHSVVINYYERAGEGDEARLAQLVTDALDFYIDRSVFFDGRRISLRNKPQVMHRDLEQIVRDAIRYYHFHDVHRFDGFSQELKNALEDLNGLVMDEQWSAEIHGRAASQDQRFLFVEGQINGVKQKIRQELGGFATNQLLVRVDSREEQLRAEQDSLLAAVRNFKTNDPLAPIDIDFSAETLNLLAGDDTFILPTYTDDDPLNNTDLADRILAMLENQDRKFDELRSEVDELRREQQRNEEQRRNSDIQMLQEQIDLLRELVANIASGRSTEAQVPVPQQNIIAEVPASGGALPGGFNVTFNTGSTQIDLDQRLKLNEMIATLAVRTDLRIMLTGFADATGNREANLRLSKLRAQAVRTYLLKSGLPEHRILINFFGDEKATGASTDRRVELRFIPRD